MLSERKFVDPEGWDNPNSDFYGKGNYGRPDKPGLSTGAMQKVLDELVRVVVAPRINQIIDDLISREPGKSGADNIGVSPGTSGGATTMQGYLDNIVSGAVPLGKAESAETADSITGYTIQDTLIASDDAIPTSKAVADAMAGAGAGDMLKSVYDPTGVNGDAFAARNQKITDTQNFYNSTNADGALNEIATKWHNITISTADPTGGNDGDIWIKVI